MPRLNTDDKDRLHRLVNVLVDQMRDADIINDTWEEADRYGGGGFGEWDEGVLFTLSDGKTQIRIEATRPMRAEGEE